MDNLPVLLNLPVTAPATLKISPNPYKTLGVKKTATLEEITRMYRIKSMMYHPDRGGDPEKFRKLRAAYEALKSKKRRKQFDADGFVFDPMVTLEIKAAARDELKAAFDLMMTQVYHALRDMEGSNLRISMKTAREQVKNPLKAIKELYEKNLKEAKAELKKERRAFRHIAKWKGYAKARDGANVLDTAYDAAYKRIRSNLRNLNKRILFIQVLLKMIDNYEPAKSLTARTKKANKLEAKYSQVEAAARKKRQEAHPFGWLHGQATRGR